MDIRELRIGNWVCLPDIYDKENDIYAPIDGILINHKGEPMVHLEGNLVNNLLKDIEPIPLTKERLLKLGFKSYTENVFIIGKFKVQFINLKKGATYHNINIIWDSCVVSHSVYYIHKLQNIYFTLTGKELQLSDKDIV